MRLLAMREEAGRYEKGCQKYGCLLEFWTIRTFVPRDFDYDLITSSRLFPELSHHRET